MGQRVFPIGCSKIWEREEAGSALTSSTRFPSRVSAIAAAAATEVLPDPPFPVKKSVFGARSRNRSPVPDSVPGVSWITEGRSAAAWYTQTDCGFLGDAAAAQSSGVGFSETPNHPASSARVG